MRILRALLSLVFFSAEAGADPNKGWSRQTCAPASHPNNGDGYCTDYQGGWENGGAATDRTFATSMSPVCQKHFRNCECPDCGAWNVKCQDFRCNDDTDFVESDTGRCYVWDVNGNKQYKGSETYTDCYKTFRTCDFARCAWGQELYNCRRKSAGDCRDCAAGDPLGMPTPSFYTTKGKCDVQPCTRPRAGSYVVKACTATSDAVVGGCSAYPGNKDSLSYMSSLGDLYYCPGENLVLRLPANSAPTADYGSFVCHDGYYLSSNQCVQCPPGSCCRFGKSFLCPEGYYTNRFAQSSCRVCTAGSTPGRNPCSNGELPMRCHEGSTVDLGCVSCGMCGYSADHGLSCDQSFLLPGSQPRQGICVPLNTQDPVAQCAP